MGLCPKCQKIVGRIEMECVDVYTKGRPEVKGVLILCPNCQTILSAGIDPLAIRTEIVEWLGGKVGAPGH